MGHHSAASVALSCSLTIALAQYALADDFLYPVAGYVANDGCREWAAKRSDGQIHLGDDFCAPAAATPVTSPAAGTIKFARSWDSCPNWVQLVVIEHQLNDGSRISSVLGHVTPTKSEGAQVSAGEQVGVIASYAPCSSDHIHYALYDGPFGGNEGDYQAWIKGYVDPSQFPEPAGYLDPIGFTNKVGQYSDGWHGDGSSKEVLHAYSRNRAFISGAPAEDVTNPNGTLLHQWGAFGNVWVQNFYDSDFERNAAIVYDTNTGLAAVIRAGFWAHYGAQGGPSVFGTPLADEVEAEQFDCGGNPYRVFQQFTNGTLVWDGTPGHAVEWCAGTSGQLTIAISAQNGNDTFALEAQSVSSSQVVLDITSTLPGPYDTYDVYRNGAIRTTVSAGTSSITDNSVAADSQYTYWLNAKIGGFVSQTSNVVTVATPPGGGTGDIQLVASMPTGDSVRLDIVESGAGYFAYGVRRNGRIVGYTTNDVFVDTFVEPGAFYSYSIDFIDEGGVFLGSEGNSQILIPSNATLPITPKAALPLEIFQGITLSQTPINEPDCPTSTFTLRNTGGTTIELDTIVPVTNYYELHSKWLLPRSRFFFEATKPTISIGPGGTYAYVGDSCDDPFDNVLGRLFLGVYVKPRTGDRLEYVDSYNFGAGAQLQIFNVFGGAYPDLEVTAVRVRNAPAIAGETVLVEFDITNNGTDYAFPSYLQVEHTQPPILHSEVITPALGVGESTTILVDIGTYPEGEFSLAYDASEYRDFYEADYVNNSGTFEVAVVTAPAVSLLPWSRLGVVGAILASLGALRARKLAVWKRVHH